MYNNISFSNLFNDDNTLQNLIKVDYLIVNNSLILIDFVITSFLVDNSTTNFNGSVQLKVKNGGIITAKLANLSSITVE
jgi:hypothetical protein